MNGNGMSLELDSTTGRIIESLADVWGVSREEVVRRAVEQAQTGTARPSQQDRLDAFKKLQASVKLSEETATRWQESAREGRR